MSDNGKRLDEVIPLFFSELDNQLGEIQESITAFRRAVDDLRETQRLGLKNLGDMLREQVNANAQKITLTQSELNSLKLVVAQHLEEHRLNNPQGWRHL